MQPSKMYKSAPKYTHIYQWRSELIKVKELDFHIVTKYVILSVNQKKDVKILNYKKNAKIQYLNCINATTYIYHDCTLTKCGNHELPTVSFYLLSTCTIYNGQCMVPTCAT